MRNDDEDEDEKTPAAPKDGGPSALLIQKKFLEQRKIFLWGAVEDASARDIVEKLLYLDGDRPRQGDHLLHQFTPGGSITSGMAVYDTIRMITSPMKVVVTGMAASMGSILLSRPPRKRATACSSRTRA
jgi:ATP-dependent Clp protease protease subunit